MTADRWIVIPRWDEFQHRDAARVLVPTWIKTFSRLLSDQAYLDLTGHRRAVLHGIWLEYARSRRQLTDNTRSLTRRLSLKVTRSDLEALNHAGFIGFSASNPASNPASTPAGTEKRREEQLLPRAVTSTQDVHPTAGFAHTAAGSTNEQPPDFTHIGALIDQSLRNATA